MENFHLVNYFNYLSIQLAFQSFEHNITLKDFQIKFINWYHNIQILQIIVASSIEFLEYNEIKTILHEIVKT